jgi:ubiquinone/menaquinone biosynthesis C-methylase UbiE
MDSGWQLQAMRQPPTPASAIKSCRSVGCRDGDRVLDVACGTGIVANRISLVSGKLCPITGIDLNEGMLSIARRNTQVEWCQGSVADMPFDPESFEVVLCQQGLQYFPDRARAMSEMARVLSPGGCLALNVWGALDRQPFHAAVIAGVGEFLGAEAEAAFDLAFSLNTADELRHLARDAGLNDIRVRFEHRTLRYPVSAGMVVGFMGATPVTPQFAALPDDDRKAFVAYVVGRLASYVDDAGLAVPVENHFLTALKPT